MSSSSAPMPSLAAYTESAQRGSKPGKKGSLGGSKPVAGPRYGGPRKAKSSAIEFDEKARADYLTGFSKRKQARKEAGREFLRKKLKEEQQQNKRDAREARKQQAAENVKAERRALGLDSQDEADDDDDDGQEDEHAPFSDQEYDNEDFHTHVVVHEFDPDAELRNEEKRQAKVVAQASKDRPPAAATKTGASLLPIEALPPSSAKANKANATGTEEAKEEPDTDTPKQKPDTIQKRLHVSGLTDQFTQEELIRRFSTFGKVVTLDEWPGKRDANGSLRPFAYMTIESTQPQISRCINLLSGSMWKGAKLRVGEAKPDFQQRHEIQLEKEKRRAEQEAELRETKRRRLPAYIGVEASNMQPVTEERVNEGLWGWKRTPAGHLVRPLHLRPDHPLPKPNPLKNPKDKDGEKTSKGARRPRANAIPPKRAKRVTIDPTRYGAVHITGLMLESQVAEVDELDKLGPGEWECEEIDEETAIEPDTRLVRWKYMGKEGKLLHEEFARLSVRRVAQDAMSTPEEAAGDRPASNTKQPASQSAALDAEDEDEDEFDLDDVGLETHSNASSDLFAGFKGDAQADGADWSDSEEDAASDFFAGLDKTAPGEDDWESSSSEEEDDDDEKDEAEPPATSTKSIAVQAIKAADYTLRFAEDYDPDAESDFSDGYEEGPAAASAGAVNFGKTADERKQLLGVLGDLFGQDEISRDEVGDAPVPLYTPVAEMDSDEDDVPEPRVERVDEVEMVDEAEQPQPQPQPQPREVGVRTDKKTKNQADATVAPEPTGKNRRAGLIVGTGANKAEGAFTPIVRFDPSASGEQQVPEQAEKNAEMDLEGKSAEREEPSNGDSALEPDADADADAAVERRATEVKMTKLKDMFRPQEDTNDGAGFSLLGGLTDGLELDEDLDFGAAEAELDAEEREVRREEVGVAPVRARGASSWFDGDTRIPFLFPSKRTSGARCLLELIRDRELKPLVGGPAGTTVGWEAFCRTETEEELQAKWEERKTKLTQDYKKRHREAIRKKRKRFIGGRGAAAAAAAAAEKEKEKEKEKGESAGTQG